MSRARRKGRLSFWTGSDEISTESQLAPGKWQLLTAAFDGSNLQDSGPWNYGDPVKFFTTRGRGFSKEIGLPAVKSSVRPVPVRGATRIVYILSRETICHCQHARSVFCNCR